MPTVRGVPPGSVLPSRVFPSNRQLIAERDQVIEVLGLVLVNLPAEARAKAREQLQERVRHARDCSEPRIAGTLERLAATIPDGEEPPPF